MKTLPAAAVPVAVATALAARSAEVDWVSAVNCLAFAVLLQIATNFENDYQDFVRGADTAERRGPRRAVASGWVSPGAMRLAARLTFGLAFLVGLGLVAAGGWVLIPLGMLCTLCGYLYTGGPKPLAYNGLGDVFVFVFFGLVAVGGTHLVLAGSVTAASLLAGASIGLLAVNLLVVNNTRDIETDGPAGKRTLAVRIGEYASKRQYRVQLFLAYLLLLPLGYLGGGPWVACALPVAPFGLWIADRFYRASEGPGYNRCLAQTALHLLLFGALLTLGLAFK